jgi:hypothetical protein
MYALGSVGWVGSWFFISATSNVRKSFAVIVEVLADAAAEAADVDGALPVDAVAADALGRASALATVVAEFATSVAPVAIC